MSYTYNNLTSINHNSNLFELLFQNVANLIFTLDKNLVLQQINQHFYQVTYYQKETILQKNLEIIISKDSYQLLQPKLTQLLEDKQPFTQDIDIYTANNDKLHCSIHFDAIIQDDEIIGILAVENNNDKIQQLEDKIYQLKYTDPITHLGNRQFFLKKAKEFFQQITEGTLKHFLLLAMDFDDFKKVDDLYGYEVGDKVIKMAGKRLLAISKPSDVPFRVSGTRLGILSPIDDISMAKTWAENIMNCLTRIYQIDGHLIDIQISIGAVCMPQDATTVSEVINHVELAYYKAKETRSHSNIVFYNKELSAKIIHTLKIENQLKEALKADTIEAFYQPQFSLPNRKLQGFEALARWRDPERGLVAPMDFIPIAEETGLIIKIGNRILEQACKQSLIWEKKGFQHKISINISIIQIKDENFYADVVDILQKTGVNPHNIEFEMTESIVITNMKASINLLHKLKKLGISIALDDFGTGYSSLSYIKQIPVDVLKIDRAFIQNIPHSPKDCAIAKMILILAKELVVKVIAEGMEKEEQVLFLEKEECDVAQGFYFSHPLEASEADKLVDDYLAGKDDYFEK